MAATNNKVNSALPRVNSVGDRSWRALSHEHMQRQFLEPCKMTSNNCWAASLYFLDAQNFYNQSIFSILSFLIISHYT